MRTDSPRQPLPRRGGALQTASWVVLGVVLVIGIVATGVSLVQERRTAHSRERAALTAGVAAVQDAAGTAAAALGGGAALVEDDGQIDTDRLPTFARDVADVSSLQAVGLVEVVPDDERAAVETRLGRPIFAIDGETLAPAEVGVDHWVVTRVVPQVDLTSNLLGFDILSNPISGDSARAAARTGAAMITPAVVIPAEMAAQLGVDGELVALFVLKPLYGPGADGDAGSATDGLGEPIIADEDRLAGFLVSALTGEQLSATLADSLPEGVAFRVQDGATVLAGEPTGARLDGPTSDLEVLGRTWRIQVDDRRPVSHAFSLTVGAVTLVLLGVLVLVAARERRRQDHLRRVGAAVRGTARLATAFSAAPAVPEVVSVIERDLAPLLGATDATLLRIDTGAGVLTPDPASTTRPAPPPIPLDTEPVVRALGGEIVVIRSMQRSMQGLPEQIAVQLRNDGTRAVALLPLSRDQGRTEALVLIRSRSALPDESVTTSTLTTVTELCEQALSRAATTDRNTRQAGALASLAEELARADTVEQVCDAVLRSGRQPMRASAISIGLIDHDADVLRVHHGESVDSDFGERYRSPSLRSDLAFTDAARTGDAVLVSSFAEYQERYPGTDPGHALLGQGARAAVPLLLGGESIGAIAIAWDRDREFDDATMFGLATIAELASQAVQRARLMDQHQRDADRSRELASVAQQLAVLRDGDPLARFVVDEAARVAGADAALLVVDDAIGWHRTASTSLGDHPELVERLLDHAAHIGATDSVGTDDLGTDGVHTDAGPAGTPPLGVALSRAGLATSATLTLRDRDGQGLGVLWLGWRSAVRLDDDLRDVVNTLVGMTAQSVGRCLLTDQLRADADRNERLATFARRLANVGDVVQLCDVVIDDGGQTVGAVVANLGLVDETGDRLVVRPNDFFDPATRSLFETRSMSDSTLPGVEAIATGKPVLLPTPDEIAARYPGRVADAMAAHGLRSSAHLPLLAADGTAIGCIGFAWDHTQAFRPTKLARLRTIAELCTQTLERARLADAEHRLVDNLHRRVVGRTPTQQSVAIATRYLPATEEIGMGGDWYDAVALGDSRYAVIVGDVTGHGISAVADMIELRAATRSLLQHGVPLEQVFSRVSASWSDSTESLATACISVVDTDTDTLEHVSAGHIPALVRRPDGSVEAIEGGRQPLLGVPGRASAPATVPFPPGSSVVMCSDGLIERRDRSIDESIDALARELRNATRDLGDVEALADRLIERCLGGPTHDDDVVLAAVQHVGRRGGGGVEQSFPAVTGSIAAARRFAAESAGTGAGVAVDDLALVASELVTNAVLHGRGPLTVRVEHHDGVVRLAVHDHGEGHPTLQTPRADAEGGRGLGIVETLSSRWGVERHGSGKWVWAELGGSIPETIATAPDRPAHRA